MTSETINQLRLLQQNLQNVTLQKQHAESQLIEINSALSALKATDKTYKILGKIMVAASKEDVQKDLMEKQTVATSHLKNFQEQELKLQDAIKSAQQSTVSELKND